MAAESHKPDDDVLIRALIDDVTNAIRAKDAGGVAKHHADDFVHFSLAPPLRAAADPKALEAWFATWRGTIGYETRDLSIVAGNDVAFCHSLNHMSGVMTDGERTDLWFRLTIGLRKVEGVWKVVHEHESVPFYMDGSMKAATDPKP